MRKNMPLQSGATLAFQMHSSLDNGLSILRHRREKRQQIDTVRDSWEAVGKEIFNAAKSTVNKTAN
jgi:hypothetical protein